jgi:hypothetical protein
MTETKIFPAKVIKRQNDEGDGYMEVVINKGRDDGIKEGQNFVIYKNGEELLDPDSGESLGCLEVVRGRGYAAHVQEKMTTISSTRREGGYSYRSPNTLERAAHGLRGTIKEGRGKIVPFKDVMEGDLAKPI